VRDGVELQKRKVPQVTICHDVFERAARQQAASLGYGNLPIVVVPQPKPHETPDVITRRADQTLPEILGHLVATSQAQTARA